MSAPPGRRPRRRSGRVAVTASILAPGRGRGRCTGRGHEPARPGWDTDRMTVSSPGRAVGTAPSPAAASSAPALGAVTPSRAEFRELAALHRVIPVTRRLLADDETPVGVYRKLAGDRPGTFLFESAENGRSWSRWSFVGARSRGRAHRRRRRARAGPARCPTGCPPPATRSPPSARSIEELASEPLPGLPPLTGGMVGYLGYDIVRRLERLPELRRRRPAHPRAGDAAGHRPRRRRPPRGHGHAHRQRDQLGRERRARRRGLRRRRGPARPDDRRPGRARTLHGGRSTSPPSPRSPAVARPRSTTPPSRPRRSRSGRARRSRSWCRSGSRCRARRRRWTSTGCCGPPTRARTCTCCGCERPHGRALRHRRLQPGGAGHRARRRGHHAPDRRHPVARGDRGGGHRCWRRTCAPTRRSAPST